MGWDDDDEVNKLAKDQLSHDLHEFLIFQDWSPISFTRICNTDIHDVVKQYIEYSRNYERTCTERDAISELQKYHEHTTKIIYSLLDRCGGTVASTDDDVDVDVDVDEDDAVAVPIPASCNEEEVDDDVDDDVEVDVDVDVDVDADDADDAVAVPIPASCNEEDPDDDVVEAVVVTQTATPDTSDLISSGNQYLVAFTEAMITMAKKNRSKGGRRTKNPPSKIPQNIQDQATMIIRKEFSGFQASDSIHSSRILKSVITAAWSSIHTQIDQSDTETDAALLKKVVVNICAELRAIFPKRAMFYLMSSLAKKQKRHFVWQATMALSVVSNQLSMTPHELLLKYKTFRLLRKTSTRRHLSRFVHRSFSIHYVDNCKSNEFLQIDSAVKHIVTNVFMMDMEFDTNQTVFFSSSKRSSTRDDQKYKYSVSHDSDSDSDSGSESDSSMNSLEEKKNLTRKSSEGRHVPTCFLSYLDCCFHHLHCGMVIFRTIFNQPLKKQEAAAVKKRNKKKNKVVVARQVDELALSFLLEVIQEFSGRQGYLQMLHNLLSLFPDKSQMELRHETLLSLFNGDRVKFGNAVRAAASCNNTVDVVVASFNKLAKMKPRIVDRKNRNTTSMDEFFIAGGSVHDRFLHNFVKQKRIRPEVYMKSSAYPNYNDSITSLNSIKPKSRNKRKLILSSSTDTAELEIPVNSKYPRLEDCSLPDMPSLSSQFKSSCLAGTNTGT